ncbi:Transportin-1, partial [Spiromyces aspiralis]
MDWKPDANSLAQLIELLKNTQSTNNQVQHENSLRLNELRKVPDFPNYLLFVLTSMQDQSAQIRAVAGLLLKNNVQQDFHNILPEVLNNIKQRAL